MSNVATSPSPPGGYSVRTGVRLRKVRLAPWNIEPLTGKSMELVKFLYRRKISITCVQETKWVESKARIVDGYKLWYSGSFKAVSYTHLTLPTKRIV